MAAVADLGGSILTGIDGNPLAVLARQLRIPLHAINSEGVPLYCSNGKEANRRLDQQVRCFPAPCRSPANAQLHLAKAVDPQPPRTEERLLRCLAFSCRPCGSDSSLESPRGILLESHTKLLPQLQILNTPCRRHAPVNAVLLTVCAAAVG